MFRSTALGLVVTALAAVPAQARAEIAPPKPAEQATAPAGRVPAVVSTTHARPPATPGSGLGSVDTSMCAQLPFTQPFAPFGDYAFYTLMPGQSVGDFTGTGWSFNGGAATVSTRLRDGSTGQVLNLPGGSSAVSPPMCVNSNYPTGRTMIRDMAGSAGVQFQVAYKGSKSWVKPRHTGLVHGNSRAWTPSHMFDIRPYRTTGWQIVRFRLSVRKHTGDYELYNLYVDPHMVK